MNNIIISNYNISIEKIIPNKVTDYDYDFNGGRYLSDYIIRLEIRDIFTNIKINDFLLSYNLIQQYMIDYSPDISDIENNMLNIIRKDKIVYIGVYNKYSYEPKYIKIGIDTREDVDISIPITDYDFEMLINIIYSIDEFDLFQIC